MKYRQSILFCFIYIVGHFSVAREGEKPLEDLRNFHKSPFVVVLNIMVCSFDVKISVIRTTALDKLQQQC